MTSAAMDEAVLEPTPSGLHYGLPCAFAGCSGFVHPAAGQAANTVGVVLCAPWGFEDLIMRKSWRLLAEAIAKAGTPCIRFDYPGTGDSLGHATDVTAIDEWIASIGAAADTLRLHTGVRRFVFIGQSLGATLAVEAARCRGDVVGLHLIAPVVSGRAYARELGLTATMVANKIGIKLEPTPVEGLSMMGFALSHPMLESLKRLDLRKIEALGVESVTIFDQIDRKAGAEAVEHFRKLGVDVAVETVAPYHLMVSDATMIAPLPVGLDRILSRLALPAPAGLCQSESIPVFPAALMGECFLEEPIRFGPDEALFGVLCRPLRPRAGTPAIILLNRGLNPHVGWRRVSVDQARGLAAAGITSLRIDVAGLGESRDEPGRPPNLIYSDLLIDDIKAAVDVLADHGFARIALAGVCSGAYMALAAVAADPRVTDVIAINTQRLVWNPRESVDDVIRYGLRSMNDYVGDIRGRGALRKLVRSRHRIVPALRFLAKRSLRDAIARVPLRLRSAVLRGSMAARVDRFFATLAARGTRVSLVYSEGDPGLKELYAYFGERGRNLRHPSVSISILPDADHNLTTTRASEWMLEHMIAFVGEGGRPDTIAPSTIPRAARSALSA